MTFVFSYGQECEISVSIFDDDYYGDEVFWELTDGNDNIVLSGGGYGEGYSDTQTIYAVTPPYTLVIIQDGFYCDNTPSYLVTVNGSTILSGSLPEQCDITTLPLTYDFSGCSVPEAPECATEPALPANGATDVDSTGFTLSWTAPASGVTPTSYTIYVGLDPDELSPTFYNVTDTSLTDIVAGYGTTYYWQVVPTNSGSDASGCEIWSFTTLAVSAPTPDAVLDVDTCDAIETISFAYNSSVKPVYWIQINYNSVVCESITFDTFTTVLSEGAWSNDDTEIALFDDLGNFLGTNDDADGDTLLSLIDATGIPAGTYFIATGPYNMVFDDGYVANYTSTDVVTGTIVVNANTGAALSIDDDFDSSKLKVYPNPVSNVLNLSYTTDISSVVIYNMLGQAVLSKTINSTHETLNISELNTGAYFVKVTINDRTETVRVIKQ